MAARCLALARPAAAARVAPVLRHLLPARPLVVLAAPVRRSVVQPVAPCERGHLSRWPRAASVVQPRRSPPQLPQLLPQCAPFTACARAQQEFRRQPAPPPPPPPRAASRISLPLVLALGGVALVLVGGALLVVLVPLLLAGALLSFLWFAARRGRAAVGGVAAADATARRAPPLVARWALSLLGRATAAMAARAEQQARLGRLLHHNLQARVRGAGSIRDACGRGVLLGPPHVMQTLTAGAARGQSSGGGGGGGGGGSCVVHVEAPLVHDRLGARGVLVVDAAVVGSVDDRGGAGGGAAGAAQRAWAALRAFAASGGAPADDVDDAAYQAHRRQRMEARMAQQERRQRRHAEAGGSAASLELQELYDFILHMNEDLEDEKRFKGASQPSLQFHVTRAELRLPGGRVVDLSDELGGLFVEEVVAGSGGGSAAGRRPTSESRSDRVIDAAFRDKTPIR